MALALGFVIAAVYRRTRSSSEFTATFPPTLVLLTVLIAMVTQVIGDNVLDAVRSVMTCEPDYLVMGMSAVTFFDGAKGAESFQQKVESFSGVKLSMGSKACAEALNVYGGVKRIATERLMPAS